jgi:hypothetical protein
MSNLEALAAQADMIDAEGAATEPAALLEQQQQLEQVSAVDQNAVALVAAFGIGSNFLSNFYPSLTHTFGGQAQQMAAASLAPVLAKYGFNLSEWGGQYKEEIGAAMVCVPIAIGIYNGLKMDVAEREKTAPKQAASVAVGIDLPDEPAAVLG